MDDSKYTDSSVDEERNNLFLLAAKGDEYARSQIIIDNLPLVNYFVKNYLNRGVSYDDLFQEGCYGLILAAKRYDPSRNTKFATFACAYILKYIKKALIEQQISSPINYKEDFYYSVKAYINAGEDFAAKHGRQPTDEEIARELELSNLQIKRLKLFILNYLDVAHRSDKNALRLHVSSSAEDEVIANLDISDLHANLTAREDEVIRRRLGLTSSMVPESWSKMSAEMGLSINTLRKALSTGLRKIERCLNK